MREAVVTVDDAGLDSIGLGDLVSVCRAAGLREVTSLACTATGAVLIVELESRLDESRLDALACLDRWERLADDAGGVRYLLAFTAPDLPDDVAEAHDALVGDCDPAVGERGATLSIVGPQAAIREKLGAYEDAGASVELRELGAFDGPRGPLDDLTERQREVVRTAFDVGYYEVPREASTADVAARLDLDPSTVAEHLQRAERNLLSHHLSPGR